MVLPATVLLIKLLAWAWGVLGVRNHRADKLLSDDITACSIGSPQLLLGYRLVMLGWACFIGVRQVAQKGLRVFVFYTVWNWWLLTAFFALGSVASVRALRWRGGWGSKGQERKPPRGADWLNKATLATFCVVTPMALVIDGMTWLVLVPMLETGEADPERTSYWHAMSLAVDLLTWVVLVPMLMASEDEANTRFWRTRLYCFESYNQHGFNAVMVLGDLLLNRIPVDLYASGWLALWSSLFGVWSAVFYVRTGHFIYPLLDAHKPYAWAAYLGLFVVHWAAYLTVMGLTRVKQHFMLKDKAAAVAPHPAPPDAAAARQPRNQMLLRS